MSILSFLSMSADKSSKEDLCQLFDSAEHPVPQGALIQHYMGEEAEVFYCSIPRSDAWAHTSGVVAQAAIKSEGEMKAWHEKTRVTDSVRQGAKDIAQARACVESSKSTSDWAKAQIKLMDDECIQLGQQADKDIAAMQKLLAEW